MNKDNILFKKVMNPNGEYELPRPIAPIGSLDTTDAMNKLTLLIKDRFSKLPKEMSYEEWKDYCELFVLSAKASFIDKTEMCTVIDRLVVADVRTKTNIEELKVFITQANLLKLKSSLKKEEEIKFDNLNISLSNTDVILNPNSKQI